MEKFLKLAKSQSKKSDKKIKVGAILVRKGRVLKKSHNTDKSHPLQKKLNALRFNDEFFDCCSHSQHAEFKCLIHFHKKKIDISDCSLYVYRENSRGELGNCKPCPACSWLIQNLNIKRIIYIDERKEVIKSK
jgi:deoxycytidylate deaminase